MRPARAASSARPRWTSPIRRHAGAQSFHSGVPATSLSKSLTSIPFATKRGRQWLAAIWTRLCGSALMVSSLDLVVLGPPSRKASALVVVLESVRLRAGQLPVQLGPPVVRLSRPAAVDVVSRSRRRKDLLVVVARSQRVQPRQIEIGDDQTRIVPLREHPLGGGDAAAALARAAEEVLRHHHVEQVFRGAGARHG